MTEPQHAYIASTSTQDEINQAGGIGIEGRKYTTHLTMCLDPSEAIRDCFKEFGKFIGEDTEVHIYEIDLYELDGVWPRVNYQQFNDSQLQWTAWYIGKIPASALSWINVITKKRFEPVDLRIV